MNIAEYQRASYYDDTPADYCITAVDTFWKTFFFVGSITVFFILPFGILLVLYTVIAKHLMNNPNITSHGKSSNVLKYRKQVIFMLGAVVISFFICLLPFRAFTLWIIIVPEESFKDLTMDGYYSILFFCRVMLYLNSATNPILYNLMSSKFREGFLRLLGCKGVMRGKLLAGVRKGTFHTTSTNLSSSQSGDKRRSGRIKDESEAMASSFIIRACSEDVLMLGTDCGKSEIRADNISDAVRKMNGFAKRKRSTFDDIEELAEEELSPSSGRRRGGGAAGENVSTMQNNVIGKKKGDKEVIFYQQQNDINNELESKANEVSATSTVAEPTLIHKIPTTSIVHTIANCHTRRRAFSIGHKTISIDSSDSVIKHDDSSSCDDIINSSCDAGSVEKSTMATTTATLSNGIRVQCSNDDNEAKTFLHNKKRKESFV